MGRCCCRWAISTTASTSNPNTCPAAVHVRLQTVAGAELERLAAAEVELADARRVVRERRQEVHGDDAACGRQVARLAGHLVNQLPVGWASIWALVYVWFAWKLVLGKSW